MVDFRSASAFFQDSLTVVRLWHVADGLYIWEFLTTLDFEWSVIRRRRPYRWPILVYSITRVAALISVILCLVDLNAVTKYDCQALITFELLFGYLALACSSLLIALRVVAIWNRSRPIVVLVATVWLIHVSFLIHGVVLLRSLQIPSLRICMGTNIESTRPSVIATLTTDIVLLITMLAGLLHIRLHAGGRFGLASLLWKQGVIWLLLATISEVPPVVLMCLNLNDPLNVMFQFPSFITMSIAGTRMHRALVDFGSGSSEMVHESIPRSSRTGPKARPNPMPVGLNQVEISAHTTDDQFRTSSTKPMVHDGSKISFDTRIYSEPCGVSRHDDPESGLEK